MDSQNDAISQDHEDEASTSSQLLPDSDNHNGQTQFETGILPGNSGVTVDLVHEACEALGNDERMPQEIQQLCKALDRKTILPSLLFLNNCLVPKGRFKNAAKEKAYAKFHQACVTDIKAVADVTSPALAPWLCLRTFDILVKKNYEPVSCSYVNEKSSEVDQNEHDIVEYIGGSVIHKLRKRAYRITDIDQKSSLLICLKALTIEEIEDATLPEMQSSASKKTLTSILDRGGLIRLKPQIFRLFLDLESVFRKHFTKCKASKESLDIFLEDCYKLDTVSTMLFDVLHTVDEAHNLKDKILQDILNLYFKIRIHHKCKTFMDEFRCSNQRSKREKGLRKRLSNQ